jgi:hypothetical protein
MKKKLNIQEKLYLLAYAGIPTFGKFFKENADLPEDLKNRTVCIYVLSTIVLDMQRYNEFPDHRIDEVFSTQQMSHFFDSLISSHEDDPRDIKLITGLLHGFSRFTDSGMERYADFEPFTPFEYDAWLQLIIRIQKKESVDSGLKRLVDSFVKKGFELILDPSLDEYRDPLSFFPWFEKLEFSRKEETITDAMTIWKEYEENKSYNLSGDHGEKWYQAALEFAVRITNKEHVSKVFAEKFKVDYPEVYEKFKGLAGLDEYEIPIIPGVEELKRKKEVENEMQELFGQYRHEPDELVEILNKDTRVEELSKIIITISTNIAEERYEHVRKTLTVLAQYPDCDLVKKLSPIFTQNVEEKIDAGTLLCSDVPPTLLYLTNKDLHWLF